ncbi:hypothetical protein [Archaeoglobus veneficus]|uniref:Uncharacterized protein n=1 Tax=Archaeoglobus veneficus (strain DSM 11195 / SNP6) TaxID=693661 RepID=F2KR48_ARCVS|nr:hypothetical protein [Archaeoglobus veneficus]AEA46685.1 hypothetical protein Arcve_0665 [Archaeoglobus veneficus SNP6]
MSSDPFYDPCDAPWKVQYEPQLPESTLEDQLQWAEEHLRKALEKAMLFKNRQFIERLRDVHAEVRRLLSEVEG